MAWLSVLPSPESPLEIEIVHWKATHSRSLDNIPGFQCYQLDVIQWGREDENLGLTAAANGGLCFQRASVAGAWRQGTNPLLHNTHHPALWATRDDPIHVLVTI